MAQKDLFHSNFKQALITDGWSITHDPYFVQLTEARFGEIDLGAEKMVAAEKEERKIAVEIKTFLGPSFINELHRAIGQYFNYRLALRRDGDDRTLYLAMPEIIWQSDFQDSYLQDAIAEFGIRIVTYDPAKQTIERWT